ncbi:640_t:CDS:2 [Gigaspora margarita]|uniref:640_t:CDS:1 n=1 Tax=Gigaspora margarita TaxID=4874 RepID=A0ABM8W5H0_GIGMA|nr:640_t:CDS:2 [Gigaspora margarita]
MASDIPSPNTECFECGNIHNFLWCSICETKAFIQNFHRWTSGNTKIDKAIQYTQRHASHDVGNLEWIPFENIDFIELRARSAFSTIYGGTWLEGPRIWDQNNGGWLRNGPTKCALKTIENSNQMSQEYLDNIIRYHKCLQGRYVVDCFGVTRDQNGCYIDTLNLWATETDDNNPISNLLNIENINWGRSEIIHPNAIYNGQLINFNEEV